MFAPKFRVIRRSASYWSLLQFFLLSFSHFLWAQFQSTFLSVEVTIFELKSLSFYSFPWYCLLKDDFKMQNIQNFNHNISCLLQLRYKIITSLSSLRSYRTMLNITWFLRNYWLLNVSHNVYTMLFLLVSILRSK